MTDSGVPSFSKAKYKFFYQGTIQLSLGYDILINKRICTFTIVQIQVPLTTEVYDSI